MGIREDHGPELPRILMHRRRGLCVGGHPPPPRSFDAFAAFAALASLAALAVLAALAPLAEFITFVIQIASYNLDQPTILKVDQ